ncbi:Gfo/Idh/MocA family protein [Salinisphaera hydrothermalis]|uniref:Oxidoreductase domain-containing protein n=1 Tax=Salinisphaera hydrothermalis (strain C41B8) TaxID=1304275 RepID=A0A084IHU5_SALHC|nr:Gfo/Idh/MocA family oxidoreductase [Salinisphaera hydrothermalis]KEZ76279.1 oxidoreductase domain-containing protein [Salinisphaera hydrothermalis C41B8]
MNKPIRIGMVGGSLGSAGFMGRVHRMVQRLDGEYTLRAGCFSSRPDRNRETGDALALDPTRVYADYARMARAEAARDDGIQVVSIVTPNHLHVPVARAFVEAGIHVICEKPMATSLADARSLRDLAARHGVAVMLTHNYSGYPAVRRARDLVASGALGELRIVQVDYAQDWLSEPGDEGWRGDPAQAGPAGALGDIGTHAYQLATYVAGCTATELSADLHTFVPGRRLDDYAQAMLRFAGGARGRLSVSQVSPGNNNRLQLALYGTKAGLQFDQESPDSLLFSPLGEPARRLDRGGPGPAGAADQRASRIPAGHPEGYLEAFAQLYRDFAAMLRGDDAAVALLPDATTGCEGMAFVEAMLASHRAEGRWTPLPAVAV